MPVVSVRGAARVGGPTLPVAGRAAVGPYVKGSTGEVYELIEQLQSALFGGVYRVGWVAREGYRGHRPQARGLKSGRDYAVKVLHKRELAKMHREARVGARGPPGVGWSLLRVIEMSSCVRCRCRRSHMRLK